MIQPQAAVAPIGFLPWLRAGCSYVQALGGHLEIAAVFDDERYPLALGVEPVGGM